MDEREIKTHFVNLEIFETWKNYERISQEFKLENPLNYEDLRNSFRAYYYGGIYIPNGIRKARMESFFLRFLPENFVKDYSNSVMAPVFGFESQIRRRLLNTATHILPKRLDKVTVDTFNEVWNKTFGKEEQFEIIKIRRLAVEGLVLLSKFSPYFRKYYEFLKKVRDWEESLIKKGRIY